MKRIYLTERQIKEIIGEDFMSYLPNENMASETPENSSGYETVVSDENQDDELTDTPITDKIAKDRYPMNFFRIGYTGYASGLRALSEDKKNLNETNQDLVQKQFRLGRANKEAVQRKAAELGNDRLLNNMANETSFNVKTLYKRRYDLNKMRTEDPERFARIGGARLLVDIENQLKTAKATSSNRKSALRAAGVENVYQKQGGVKNVGNNKAHTNKNTDMGYTV